MQLTDRRTVPEARRKPDRLAFKTATTTEASGQMLALDDAEGIVTAIVSVTGTEDEVQDIIVPGAYRETLAKRRPKVCWAHSWEHPIGRVLHIEELLPGDDRLPKTTKDGQPFPREAGALVATMQFNMRTAEGKNAFEAVRFYSETGECEYSIGYQVPPGQSTRDRGGVRHIKSLDLYELSVVLFGAHTMTGTISVKASIVAALERKGRHPHTGTVGPAIPRVTAADVLAKAREAKSMSAEARRRKPTMPGTDKFPIGNREDLQNAIRLAGNSSEDRDKVRAWIRKRARELDLTNLIPESWSTDGKAKAPPFTKKETTDEPDADAEDASAEKPAPKPVTDKPDSTVPDFTDGVMVALYPDPAAADAIAAALSGADETTERSDLHVTLGYLGKISEVDTSSDELVKRLTDALQGEAPLTGTIGGIGQFPADEDSENGAPTWVPVDVPGLGLLRETVVAALGDLMPEYEGKASRVAFNHAGADSGGSSSEGAARGDLGGRLPGHDPQPLTETPTDQGQRGAGLHRKAGLGAGEPSGDPAGSRGPSHLQGGPVHRSAAPSSADGSGAHGAAQRAAGAGANLREGTPVGGRQPAVSQGKSDVAGVPDVHEGCAAAFEGKALHGFQPHITIGYNIGLIDPLPSIPVTFSAVSVVFGTQRRDIHLTAKPPEEKGMTSPRLLYLSVQEVAALTALDVRKHPREGKAGGVDRNRGNAEELRRYWTTGAGGAKIRWGTPGDFTRCARLLSEHMTPENAKGYCANRHREMTGMWPGDRDNKGYDPTLESKIAPPASGKGYPRLPGSLEERHDALMGAVVEALRGDLLDEAEGRWEWPGVCIDATFPPEDPSGARVIASRHKYDGSDTSETWQMTYDFNLDGGVDLGPPERVDLQVVAVNVDTDDAYLGDALPFVEGIDQIAHAFKAASGAAMESKAGRVLSGANQRELRIAVENLVRVLNRAGLGIQIEEAEQEPGDPVQPKATRSDPRETPDPDADPATTAPSARGMKTLDDGRVEIDVAAMRSTLAAFRD